MTAIQYSPTVTDDSLPAAIRRLEAAEPGDLAVAEGGSPCAMKMEADSGRPWLLDPWGHTGAPSRVTTATVAQMGYRTNILPAERELDFEPTLEDAAAHIESLKVDGWTEHTIAEAAGVTRRSVRNMRLGIRVAERTVSQVLLVHADDFASHSSARGAERLDDLGWLLDSGVGAEQAVERCGFPNVDAARSAVCRGKRTGLLPLLPMPPKEVTIPAETDGPTAQDFVLSAVVEAERATITELSAATGLSKQGVRHHLDILIFRGDIERDERGVGRTAIYYPTSKEQS